MVDEKGGVNMTLMNTKTYYRIAMKKCAPDDIMKGRGKRPLEDTEPLVEELLERHRRPSCPDRGDSVYMREEREFSTLGVTFNEGYVHTVEPIGKVDRRDLAWIGVIQCRYHRNERLRKELCPELSDAQVADKYWSGEASNKPSWEWVAKEVRVVDVDNNKSRVRPNSTFLDTLNGRTAERPEHD
jgi:hypothetical protein